MFLSISSRGRPVFWRISKTDVLIFSGVSSLGFWIPDKIVHSLLELASKSSVFCSSRLLILYWIAIFPSKSWTWLSRALIWLVSLWISNCCCLSCSSNNALFLLGNVGKSEIWSTWDACWTGVADAVEGVFTEVTSSMDPVEFLLLEVAYGVSLGFLFLFCLGDVMVRFYLLK